MKAYVKPAMMALSISANDMLCSGDCTMPTRTDKTLSYALEKFFLGAENDGVFTPEEAGNVFASPADTCTEYFESMQYCKYNAASQGMPQLFTS